MAASWHSARSWVSWGIPVDEKQDLARVDLKKEALEKPDEQLTIALDKGPQAMVLSRYSGKEPNTLPHIQLKNDRRARSFNNLNSNDEPLRS